MLFDIVIPAYNPGEELVAALKSCYNQSYKDFVITVVDDHSSVDVDKLIWDFPNVRLIRNSKNLGPGGARNAAITSSEAGVISFLDADDLMHKDKLKNTFEILRKKDNVSMVCGNYRVLVDRKHLRMPFYKKPIKVDYKSLMRQNFVASGSVSVRKNVFEKVGLFDENYWIAEDYDMWLRISEVYKIEYLHEILYYYSVSPGSGSLTQRPDIQASHDSNIMKIRESSRERMRSGDV